MLKNGCRLSIYKLLEAFTIFSSSSINMICFRTHKYKVLLVKQVKIILES